MITTPCSRRLPKASPSIWPSTIKLRRPAKISVWIRPTAGRTPWRCGALSRRELWSVLRTSTASPKKKSQRSPPMWRKPRKRCLKHRLLCLNSQPLRWLFQSLILLPQWRRNLSASNRLELDSPGAASSRITSRDMRPASAPPPAPPAKVSHGHRYPIRQSLHARRPALVASDRA